MSILIKKKEKMTKGQTPPFNPRIITQQEDIGMPTQEQLCLIKSPKELKKKTKETRGRPRLQKNIEKELLVKYPQTHATEQPQEDSENWDSESQDQAKCKKRPWTEDEDMLVIKLVEEYGPQKWTFIANHLPGRIGKQCRERWHNHLNPQIKKSPWSCEEEWILYLHHRAIGNKWADIAKNLPGRTDNSIKNHWNSGMKRRLPELFEKLLKIKEKIAQEGVSYLETLPNPLEQELMMKIIELNQTDDEYTLSSSNEINGCKRRNRNLSKIKLTPINYKRMKYRKEKEAQNEQPTQNPSTNDLAPYTSTDLYINHTPIPARTNNQITKSPSTKQGSSSSQADPLMRCFTQSQQLPKMEKGGHNFYMAENLLSTPPMKKLKINEEFGLRVNLSPEASHEMNENKRVQEKYVEKFNDKLFFRGQKPLGENIGSQNFLLTTNSPKYYRYESPSKMLNLTLEISEKKLFMGRNSSLKNFSGEKMFNYVWNKENTSPKLTTSPMRINRNLCSIYDGGHHSESFGNGFFANYNQYENFMNLGLDESNF